MDEHETDRGKILARGEKQLESERAIVWRWTLPPGSHTGWHRHGHDYIVVPVKGGPLRIWDGTAMHAAAMEPGVPYVRAAGVTHDVINDGPGEIVFVEIETKG